MRPEPVIPRTRNGRISAINNRRISTINNRRISTINNRRISTINNRRISAINNPRIRAVEIVRIALFLIFAAGVSMSSSKAQTEQSHAAEIQAWRESRVERLTSPDGWLSLVGLSWLKDGENTFGGGPRNRVILPSEKAPDQTGSFLVNDEGVNAVVVKGSGVTHKGKPVAELLMRHDMEEEPTLLEIGSLSFYVIERGGRLGVRIKDTESNARRNFKGLEYYPVETGWRLTAHFEPYDPPKPVDIPNVLGGVFHETAPGVIAVDIGGETYRLDPIPDGDSFLLVFGDKTNGKETYGGGRFIVLDLPEEAGPIVVDFNKSYSPPCVFTPYATCPLPPPQNRIGVPVRAGERGFVKGFH